MTKKQRRRQLENLIAIMREAGLRPVDYRDVTPATEWAGSTYSFVLEEIQFDPKGTDDINQMLISLLAPTAMTASSIPVPLRPGVYDVEFTVFNCKRGK